MNRGLSRQLLVVVALLSLYGLLMAYSAGQVDIRRVATSFSLRSIQWEWLLQLIWLGVAVAVAAITYRISFRLLEWATPWLYGASLLLLTVTLVIGRGAGDAKSSKSWIGFSGIHLQPAELAKIATILMLARWFSSRRGAPTTLRGLMPPIMLAIVPALLVLKQPDLGSAVVFGGIMFAVFFWAPTSTSNRSRRFSTIRARCWLKRRSVIFSNCGRLLIPLAESSARRYRCRQTSFVGRTHAA